MGKITYFEGEVFWSAEAPARYEQPRAAAEKGPPRSESRHQTPMQRPPDGAPRRKPLPPPSRERAKIECQFFVPPYEGSKAAVS